MKFRDFLRRLIGGRSYSDRLVIFRNWKRHSIRNSASQGFVYRPNIGNEQVQKIVDEQVKKYNQEGVPQGDYKAYQLLIHGWRMDVLQEQREIASKNRWK
jgi:hypothetical protein